MLELPSFFVQEKKVGNADASVSAGVTIVPVGNLTLFIYVDPDRNESGGFLDDVGVAEGGVLHHLTRRAPGSREVDHQGFVLFLCQGQGFVEVNHPSDFLSRFGFFLGFLFGTSRNKQQE